MNAYDTRLCVRSLALLTMAVGVLGLAHGQSANPNDLSVDSMDIRITGESRSFEFNTVEDEQPRCLAHEMSSAGQGVYVSGSGVYVSGSAGGLVLGNSVSVGEGAEAIKEAANEAAEVKFLCLCTFAPPPRIR